MQAPSGRAVERGSRLDLVDAFEEPRLRPGETEVGACVKGAYDDYIESWLTQPLPALDGFAPQQLRKKPLGRIRLAELLKKLEHHQPPAPGAACSPQASCAVAWASTRAPGW